MLDDLRKFENLGSPQYFWELFCKINSEENTWTNDDVVAYFLNKVIDGSFIFDGCLEFAIAVGLMHVDETGLLLLDDCMDPMPRTVGHMQGKILGKMFEALNDDQAFQTIFSPENLSYDIVYRLVQVDKSAFGARYANFKELLISFGALTPHPDENIPKYIVTTKYRRLFDSYVLPGIRNRKIGIDQLRKSIEEKQIYGEEAEKFALSYEKERLVGHAKIGGVEIISNYDAAAGYDIVSFLDLASMEIDRFIEVKSYSGEPHFFWSRNEIETARIRHSAYFLYLVDRDKISAPGYEPLIIQDPYKEVLANPEEWDKRIENYFVSPAKLG